jgi:type I restriction enzyme, S subunit
MSKWEEKRIVDICSRVVSGGTPLKSKPEYYQNGEIPWLKTGEVKKSYIYETEEKITQQGLSNSSAKIVPKDSIIIAMYGDGNTAGSVAITKIDLTTNQACCNLILNKKVAFYGFVYFYLKGNYNNLVNLKSGGSQQNLNAQTIKNFNITIPPLPIQKKIAAIASTYDDLIENNDRRITLLEKMAEEIYREWFVRLRFPGHEQATFHQGIPEDWERKRFDEFCLLQRGFDLPDDKVTPGIYPVVASTSIKTYHNAPKVNPPVITTGRSGSLGTVLFVNRSAWPLNTTLFVKNFFSNSPYLIYYTLKFLKLENFNAGAGVPSLNRNHLGGLSMSVPPKILQNRFDENISVIFKQKENLANANEKLKQTRDRLLTRLISGKLSVEDLDIQFPPSMTEAVVDTERQ